MSRTLAVLLALAAPLLLPAALAAVVVFIAAVVVPPLGLVAGVLTDALYYTPAVSFPYATVIGAGITVVAYLVHQFIKTRIMD
jgi:hypothetical protein